MGKCPPHAHYGLADLESNFAAWHRETANGSELRRISRKFERIGIFNDFINDSHTSFVHPVREHTILLRRSEQGAVGVPPLFAREWRRKRRRAVNRILSSREQLPWHPLFGPWPLIRVNDPRWTHL
jgi:hypothetical protein